MADTVRYRPKPGEIPTRPGVYRFRDAAGRVLYVGKAKSLRARLSNYFAPLSSLHERTRRMVTTATSVEWTEVASEFEALQLEFSWIKEFHPPFNVQFRDDKSYPYLAITLGEAVPRVMVTRNKNIPDARYFGPYTHAWALRETVDLMLKPFPIRSCSDTIYRRAEQRGRPCLLGDIGKCAAPCVGRISKEDHKSMALDFASFMAGNDSRFLDHIEMQMTVAAEAQDYEAAARYRDQLTAMQTVLTKNSVVLPDTVDGDIIGIAHDELAAAVQLFTVRGGRIRGVRAWVVDKELDLALPELVETVLQNSYESELVPPKLVVVPELPPETEELQRWLTAKRTEQLLRGRTVLRVAQRGDLAALAATADQNARSALASYKTRRSSDFTARSQALSDIQDALRLDVAPLRMECFDVSHLGGTNIVASMVVFEDGLPRKDLYRRFAVSEATDDTDAIYQVLSRRLAHLDRDDEPDDDLNQNPGVTPGANPDGARGDETVVAPKKRRFAYRPQLLIVDGGQPQVAAAARAISDLGIEGLAVCGIAKRLEEIWLPHQDHPVILPRNSDALFLFQRIRDEAHRFAISFQRLKRKKTVGSQLDGIPGLGPVRVKELLRHFGSLKRLREASVEDIARVKGIGRIMAAHIRDHVNRK